ncbi:MAG: phosphatase [Clostridiaceae bacterium]|nr:phosphatase [Clostridiaceae bacterium]
MNIVADLHNHTSASTHAYSSMTECGKAASEAGLLALAITDHAPQLPDGVNKIHFMNYHVLPQEMFGIRMLYGAELNILDYDGSLDLDESIYERLDICIASFHEFTLQPGSRIENTRAYLGAMQCAYVDIIGHPDDGKIPVDFDALAKEAARMNVMLEVNNSSLKAAFYRLNTRKNLIEMLRACEKHATMIAIGSDSHYHGSIGKFDEVRELLAEVSFPEELVVNTSLEKIMDRLALHHPGLRK